MLRDANLDTAARLQRAKERLYVLGQLGGWGVFLVVQIAYLRLFAGASSFHRTDLAALASVVMVTASGLLLTHLARGPIRRWGWEELGWRALLPRILGLAFALSVAWSVFGYGFTYGLLDTPWPAKFPLFALFSASVVNGAVIFTGWFSVYFFYHIYERMQRLQVEQLRLIANAREAELRALKSQINPHFLFNSLNSLRALIDENAPRARESVTRLANMLRYSLQSGQLATVAFESEVRIVCDYLALEQIRHEERLRVRWELADEPALRALPVPPMLLQTLVENAVKYGIDPRREGGELVIAAWADGARLEIRVTNPGALDPATPGRSAASTGVGLRNASERLQLLFGGQASLSLQPEPAGCVTARVSLPLPAATP